MLVALDTSTRYAGLALYDEGGLLGEMNWLSGASHTVQLLPTLERLLGLLGREARELRAVGVALGPGSFNGLRVALSAAKGLCLALGIPLLGVGTLAATAYPHALAAEQICALIDAGRGHLYGTLYRGDGDQWPVEGLGGIATLAELVAHVECPTVFCGEIDKRTAAAVKERLGARAIVASPGRGLRRAAALAELAWRRYTAGEADDVAQTQPYYLRRPAGQPTM